MADILFLGTGADDWNINDRNINDRNINEKDGFFRRNSAALLDNKIMLDCGAHIFDFADCTGNPKLYDKVSHILITHNHSDHYRPELIRKIADNHNVTVICSTTVKNKISEHKNIEYIIFNPYEKLNIDGYIVTPVLANHDIVMTKDDASVHYIVQTPDNKTLFYGLDGAWFLRPTWAEMKQHKFDLMIFDCTVGDMDDWRIFEHNTIPMLRFMVKEIINQNLTAPNCVLAASHLAKTLHKPHKETADILKEIGLVTAYDGMEISF